MTDYKDHKVVLEDGTGDSHTYLHLGGWCGSHPAYNVSAERKLLGREERRIQGEPNLAVYREFDIFSRNRRPVYPDHGQEAPTDTATGTCILSKREAACQKSKERRKGENHLTVPYNHHGEDQ